MVFIFLDLRITGQRGLVFSSGIKALACQPSVQIGSSIQDLPPSYSEEARSAAIDAQLVEITFASPKIFGGLSRREQFMLAQGRGIGRKNIVVHGCLHSVLNGDLPRSRPRNKGGISRRRELLEGALATLGSPPLGPLDEGYDGEVGGTDDCADRLSCELGPANYERLYLSLLVRQTRPTSERPWQPASQPLSELSRAPSELPLRPKLTSDGASGGRSARVP